MINNHASIFILAQGALFMHLDAAVGAFVLVGMLEAAALANLIMQK